MINLLPPEIRQKQQVRSHLYALTVFYIIGAAVMILGPLALATYNLSLQSQESGLTGQIQSLEKQKLNQNALISQAAFLEDRLKSAATYQDTNSWDRVLDQIAAAVPTDSKISDIRMSQDATGGVKFDLDGSTADRRSVVLFADKLNENKSFVNATINTITDAVDTTTGAKAFQFSLTFSYKPVSTTK